MTKEQLIKQHGIEWYEQFKSRNNNRMMERYHNDSEYRESVKSRVKKYKKERCINDPEYRKYKKERVRARCKERYNNDPEYHKYMNKLSSTRKQTRYVVDRRIDLIKNYELAKADNFKGWDIHHKLELHPDGSVRFTKQSLINLNLYYNRPHTELIWLRSSEHRRLHGKAN